MQLHTDVQYLLITCFGTPDPGINLIYFLQEQVDTFSVMCYQIYRFVPVLNVLQVGGMELLVICNHVAGTKLIANVT